MISPEDTDERQRITKALASFTALDILTLVELEQISKAITEVVGAAKLEEWAGNGLMFYDRFHQRNPAATEQVSRLDFVVDIYAKVLRQKGLAEAAIMGAVGLKWIREAPSS